MAYDGWIEFDETELINISRTVQLAETLGIDTVWIEPDTVSWIDDARNEFDYDDITAAPWYDAGHAESAQFAGFIPMGFPGLDDSTLSSAPVEYITDGGRSGKPRSTTLSIVASVAIVASTEAGAEYGKKWLSKRLRGSRGNRLFCNGARMRYFSWPGQEDAPVMHRRDVALSRGINVTRKRTTDCSSTWLVTFTLTAGDPYEYGEPEPILERLGVAPEYTDDAVAAGRNRVPNPSFEGGLTGWTTLGSGVTLFDTTADPGPPAGVGITNDTYVRVVDDGTGATSGIHMNPRATVSGDTDYVASVWVRGPVGKTLRLRASEFDAGAVLLTTNDVNHVSVSATAWTRISVAFTTDPDTTEIDLRVTEPSETAAITFRVSNFALTNTGALQDYWDGDSPAIYDADTDTWTVFKWDGAPYNSTSARGYLTGEAVSGPLLDEQGRITLVEQSCPVWDYSPIFDPQYPALVASPTAPDFYPDGWTIADGMTFDRSWAKLSPLEPSGLTWVPVITLNASEDARMVRVSIYPGTSDFDDQCEPLFVAICTFIPALVDFVIDGEQQASYVWDGVSPVVRRVDSLVYGTDATPLLWSSFDNDDGLMVTLDVFSESGDEDPAEVTMELALVPKSD